VRRHSESITLALAIAATAVAISTVPSWRGALLDVCHQAAIAAALTTLLLVVTRALGPRALGVERVWMAVFLSGMPLVYIVSCLANGVTGAWLVLEILGLPVYAGLAMLGLKRSPWFMAVGIAAHGVAWDAWHWLLDAADIPRWYAIGCLLVDVALAAYIAARVPAWAAFRSGRGARVALRSVVT
jgi:hypothetical protein